MKSKYDDEVVRIAMLPQTLEDQSILAGEMLDMSISMLASLAMATNVIGDPLATALTKLNIMKECKKLVAEKFRAAGALDDLERVAAMFESKGQTKQ